MISAVKTKNYVTNPNLIVIQNRLFSPSYSGPGKWVIYNPDNKRAFLAAGKDTLPDIIPLLVNASKNPVSEMEITQHKYERMLNAGLLIESTDNNGGPSNFTSSYHKAVFNYPFRDYNDEQWHTKDRETMGFYSKLWDHPLMITEREGEEFKLPDTARSNLDNNQEINLKYLSILLKSVFGPISEIEGYPVPRLRKISPSGGGKHPTEGVVVLPKDYELIPKGIYVYDVKKHSLVKENGYIPERFDISSDTFGILLRNRVERPMWRYREIRSYRAIMLDSGHVVENIKQLASYNGLYTQSFSPISKETLDFSWIREPEIAFILIGPKEGVKNSKINNIEAEVRLPQNKRAITNPSLYFTFNNGNLICNALWPEIKRFYINYKDFEILTHCLPSRRGDRDVTDKGLINDVFATNQNITVLKTNFALLPEPVGKNFYKELNLWIRHNWYLNFLLSCEVRSSIEQDHYFGPRRESLVDNIEAIFNRETTRKFNTKQLTEQQFKKIITNLIPKDQQNDDIKVVVNAKNIENLTPALYSYNFRENSLDIIGEALSADEVRQLIIGQKWAGSGSLDIWACVNLNLNKPGAYEREIMKLGEIGQRICITCTGLDLGVFTTPAVKDKETFEALKLRNDELTSVLYHFTIGYKEN